MGNKIQIQLNSKFYFPNQTIQGMVIIEDCQDTLKEFSKLYINLQGEEAWDKGFECLESNDFNIFHSQFKLLKDINEERNPDDQKLKIQKTIVIPFTYTLPDNIPGSMKREKGYKLKIEYSMSLIAETLQLDRILLKKLPIIINQYAVRQNNIRNIANSHAIRGYCYTYQGIAKLDCKYSGEEFSIGDSINLELQIDLRESKQYIQEIVISLNKRTTINHQEPIVIIEQISKHNLPGVVQGIVQTIKKSIVLFDFNNKIELSTTGQLIKVDYLIRIQANSTLFNINNNDLRIDIPINLFQRRIKLNDLKFETNQIKDLFHLYDVNIKIIVRSQNFEQQHNINIKILFTLLIKYLMGNNQSGVQIAIDKFYYTEELLSGKLLIDKSKINSIQAITIRFKGEISLQIEGESVKREFCIYEGKFDENELQSIRNQSGVIEFELQLSNIIPPSVYYQQYRSRGGLQYKLEVELNPNGFFDLEILRKDIEIRQSMPKVKEFSIIKELNLETIFSNYGTLNMDVNVNEQQFHIGQTAEVTVFADNTLGQVDIDYITVEHIQEISIKPEHVWISEIQLINSQAIIGVKAFQKYQSPIKVLLTINDPNQKLKPNLQLGFLKIQNYIRISTPFSVFQKDPKFPKIPIEICKLESKCLYQTMNMIDQVKLPNKIILKPVVMKLDELDKDFIEFKTLRDVKNLLNHIRK
ncbi:unnamed protein product [Paramecium pentaurelia]|uniref:Arrestin C-terminal-like domain-containing protein n=1 Tax=Paramecium pentaurelia TaxID=43138 RepID=A0A8S1XDP2_9CILI|nr:unnamed protein product [Paramecium pentaurelia]